MGSLFSLLGFCFWVFLFISASSEVRAGVESVNGTIFIDGKSSIAKINSDFICATLDWWPPEKCDYGKCSWDHASLLNLDLNNSILFNAVKAFSPLKIRLGGTLQDKVRYQTEDHQQPCVPFTKNISDVFSFSEGCLPLSRWDELNSFFKKTGAQVIFGLNALNGRSIQSDSTAVGAWDPTNAESLIRYTVKKGYPIHGWELGNELCGTGVGLRVAADQYAIDTINLQNLVQEIYKDTESKPLVVSPGGFFEENWFKEFLNKTGKFVDVVTHHIYNLGPGVEEHLVERILDPSTLDNEIDTFRRLQSALRTSENPAVAWVGEAGGAYNSGHNLVSNAFVYSFWYLDQLAMSSVYDTKSYCRQSLIGGNYGLLNTTNFVPNPDYYSALLWHNLMGRNVLSTSFSGTKKLRAYAHCAKHSLGITLLLINLDNSTSIQPNIDFNGTLTLLHKHRSHHRRSKVIRVPHKGNKRSEATREEYHLTAKDGNLHSQVMLLNGKSLTVDSSGNIPLLEPLQVNSSEPITVAPLSIVFAHIPYVKVPACR